MKCSEVLRERVSIVIRRCTDHMKFCCLLHILLVIFSITVRMVDKVMRRTFGPRRDEVTGDWRRPHNEELNDLYCSPNILRVIKSKRMRWAGHVARMGEERGVYRVLVGKPEG